MLVANCCMISANQLIRSIDKGHFVSSSTDGFDESCISPAARAPNMKNVVRKSCHDRFRDERRWKKNFSAYNPAMVSLEYQGDPQLHFLGFKGMYSLVLLMSTYTLSAQDHTLTSSLRYLHRGDVNVLILTNYHTS